MSDPERWPALPLNEWQPTYRTLHMWTQIAGKIRMTLSPPLNHWWHVTLYVNSRGLTTGPIPYPPGVFEIQFDFEKHTLDVSTSEGTSASRSPDTKRTLSNACRGRKWLMNEALSGRGSS